MVKAYATRAFMLALAAVPFANAFNVPKAFPNLSQKLSSAASQGPSSTLSPAASRGRGLAFGFSGLASTRMGLLDQIFGAAGPRSYSDLVSGERQFQGEAAEYAQAGEVKAISKDGHSIATFAGGCFWGLELAYQRVPGVVGTSVGYTQGGIEHPSYEAVCTGATGHTEVVQLTYKPKEVSYTDLCKLLFTRINPTLKDQVGNDRGTQYRHGIYFHTPEQKKEAEAVMSAVKSELGGAPFYTELEEAKVYYPAEEYHQQYLEKGGRGGRPQSAEKGATETIRCYG